MKDLFDKVFNAPGPLGKYAEMADGYFMFPELEGQISNRMRFRGQEMIVWSLNNYLGLANHPAIREADTRATEAWGLAAPMGARMMSGETRHHHQLEKELSDFVGKEAGYLLNYGYQGIMSVIDAILSRRDVVVYDNDCHACIVDALRMHPGNRFAYLHNDMESFETNLRRASVAAEQAGGGVLVISEGVFGMQGDQGKLKEIVAFKKDYNFRFLVDDAHGFGTLGATGAGAGEEQGVQDQIDLYFCTFAKSMASIGAYIGGDAKVINFLKHNMRSQIFAKSMPLPYVIGNTKRLHMLRDEPEHKAKLWNIVNALQDGLRQRGFNLGETNSCVTPVFLNGTTEEAANLVSDLRERYKIFCSLVVYPVVPKGIILLRLIPTAVHTLEDVQATLDAFDSIKSKLEGGHYKGAMVDISTL